MRSDRVYYVESSLGACLVRAADRRQVRSYMRREYGRVGTPEVITTDEREIARAKEARAVVHDARPRSIHDALPEDTI